VNNSRAKKDMRNKSRLSRSDFYELVDNPREGKFSKWSMGLLVFLVAAVFVVMIASPFIIFAFTRTETNSEQGSNQASNNGGTNGDSQQTRSNSITFNDCDNKSVGEECKICPPSTENSCLETLETKYCEKRKDKLVCVWDEDGNRCSGKPEGFPCTTCPTGDTECLETQVVKTCQNGKCKVALIHTKVADSLLQGENICISLQLQMDDIVGSLNTLNMVPTNTKEWEFRTSGVAVYRLTQSTIANKGGLYWVIQGGLNMDNFYYKPTTVQNGAMFPPDGPWTEIRPITIGASVVTSVNTQQMKCTI